MIRLLAEAAFAMSGIGRILLFRPDWHEKFDLSEKGLIRSFGAILISLPVYLLMQAFFGQLAPETAALYPAWYYLVDLARLWILFPIAAAVAVIVTGLKKDYAAWLTVRNWSVLAQMILVTIVAATAVAGLSGQAAIGIFFVLFYPAFLTVLHLSIAFVVLRGPWPRVAGAALIVLLSDFLSRQGLTALVSAYLQAQPA